MRILPNGDGRHSSGGVSGQVQRHSQLAVEGARESKCLVASFRGQEVEEAVGHAHYCSAIAQAAQETDAEATRRKEERCSSSLGGRPHSCGGA